MSRHTWWDAPGVTTSAQVEWVARVRGVLRGSFTGRYTLVDGGTVEVPMVLVDVHGHPWAVYPSPDSDLGWCAASIEPGGAVSTRPGADGWLGVRDLEADRIVANLLDDELPAELYERGPTVALRLAG